MTMVSLRSLKTYKLKHGWYHPKHMKIPNSISSDEIIITSKEIEKRVPDFPMFHHKRTGGNKIGRAHV